VETMPATGEPATASVPVMTFIPETIMGTTIKPEAIALGSLTTSLQQLVESMQLSSDQTLAKPVSDLVATLQRLVGGLLTGLLGSDKAPSLADTPSIVTTLKDVADKLERVAEALLLGNGAGHSPGDTPSLITSLKDTADKLQRLVGGLLTGLLGSDKAPSSPVDTPSLPAALETLAGGLQRLIEGLQQYAHFGAIGNLAQQQLDSFFIGVGSSNYPVLTGTGTDFGVTEMVSTTIQETPVKDLPNPSNDPLSSFFLGGAGFSFSGSGQAHDVLPLLFLGVLAMFAIFIRGGRFSWPSYQLFKPTSALRLVPEHPG
jgi:hypothetical protein